MIDLLWSEHDEYCHAGYAGSDVSFCGLTRFDYTCKYQEELGLSCVRCEEMVKFLEGL